MLPSQLANSPLGAQELADTLPDPVRDLLVMGSSPKRGTGKRTSYGSGLIRAGTVDVGGFSSYAFLAWELADMYLPHLRQSRVGRH